jgi:hypothetical protein
MGIEFEVLNMKPLDLGNLVSRLHRFAWEAFKTRTGSTGAMGNGEDTGKRLYGANAKRALSDDEGTHAADTKKADVWESTKAEQPTISSPDEPVTQATQSIPDTPDELEGEAEDIYAKLSKDPNIVLVKLGPPEKPVEDEIVDGVKSLVGRILGVTGRTAVFAAKKSLRLIGAAALVAAGFSTNAVGAVAGVPDERLYTPFQKFAIGLYKKAWGVLSAEDEFSDVPSDDVVSEDDVQALPMPMIKALVQVLMREFSSPRHLHRFADWDRSRSRTGGIKAVRHGSRPKYGAAARRVLGLDKKTPPSRSQDDVEGPADALGEKPSEASSASLPSSPLPESPPAKESRARRAWSKAVELGRKAKEAKTRLYESLPPTAQKVVNGVQKVAGMKQAAADKAVAAVIRERGYGDEHVAAVTKWTSMIDWVSGWAAKLTTVGLIRNLPLGTFGYLVASTAQNPLATMRAAKNGIKAAMDKLYTEASEAITDPEHPYPPTIMFSDTEDADGRDDQRQRFAGKILDAVQRYGAERLDAYMACVFAGIDEGLSGDKLFQVADYMMDNDHLFE